MRIFDAPETRIAIFGFLAAFFWEMWQMPFYRTAGSTVADAVQGCTLASLGDAGIMVFAYLLTARAVGDRRWLVRRTGQRIAIFLVIGLVVTIGIEHVALRVPFGWRYAESMPVEPLFGTGLVPIIMWIVVPLVTLWLATLREERTIEE